MLQEGEPQDSESQDSVEVDQLWAFPVQLEQTDDEEQPASPRPI